MRAREWAAKRKAGVHFRDTFKFKVCIQTAECMMLQRWRIIPVLSSMYQIILSRIIEVQQRIFMGTLCTATLAWFDYRRTWTQSRARSRPGLSEDEKPQTDICKPMRPPILTHVQGCVTRSKIRPVAPGCPPVSHGGPWASSKTPLR